MSEAPEVKLLTPNGGLPAGNWDKKDLIPYIRKDIHEAAVQESHELGLKAAFEAFVDKKQEAAFALEAVEVLADHQVTIEKALSENAITDEYAWAFIDMAKEARALLSKHTDTKGGE